MRPLLKPPFSEEPLCWPCCPSFLRSSGQNVSACDDEAEAGCTPRILTLRRPLRLTAPGLHHASLGHGRHVYTSQAAPVGSCSVYLCTRPETSMPQILCEQPGAQCCRAAGRNQRPRRQHELPHIWVDHRRVSGPPKSQPTAFCFSCFPSMPMVCTVQGGCVRRRQSAARA